MVGLQLRFCLTAVIMAHDLLALLILYETVGCAECRMKLFSLVVCFLPMYFRGSLQTALGHAIIFLPRVMGGPLAS